MAIDMGPFGGYVDITEAISDAATLAILAEIDKLAALIPDFPFPTNVVSGGQPAPHPEFDRIDPSLADRLQDEIVALKAAIDAAPAA